MLQLSEPLINLYTRSRILVLDFSNIPANAPDDENIEAFFNDSIRSNSNPRLPENRQRFNDQLLEKTGALYLIGQYGENRISMLNDTPAGSQGRTIHMALDIFTKDMEPIFAPCDGNIQVVGYESGFGEYGHYLIFKPADTDIYLFFGHLSANMEAVGPVRRGDSIARIGSYIDNENGGWSRHLHLQVLTELPSAGKTPDGYSTRKDFEANRRSYPDPKKYFTEWSLIQTNS